MKKWVPFILFLSIPLWVFGLTACRERVVQSPGSRKLQVVATTTIVGDVVYQISAGLVDFDVLLPVGSDPHGFYPTPQDVAMIADADIVFANGAGLEAFLEDLIDSAGAKEKLVSVSEGVDFLTYGGEGVQDHGNGSSHDELEEEEPEYQDETEEGHLSGGVDPHTWTDPNNVMIWIQNITHVLIEHDPENRITYETNAVKYQAELLALDAWIREEVAQIPEVDRRLVTDHTIFSYFVDEYGFEQVGALIPGYSILSEPTAQELAEIEDAIITLGVKAVFIGNSVNPSLAQRVASDTGVELIYVYTGSLGDADGEAGTYLAYMRFNTTAFVSALK